MPKDTKSSGNNKAPACESRGFGHKKEGENFDTPSFFCLHSGGYMEYFHTFVWANLQLPDWEQSVNRTYNTLINNK